MEYLDANVLVRYLTKDDPHLAARAYAFLQEVEQGERIVAMTEAVLAEVIYVLSSKNLYALPRPEMVKRLLPVVLLKNLRIGCKPSEKQMYTNALHLYETTSLDFPDVLIVARMRHEGVQIVISFDTDFDRFPDIRREEPEEPMQALEGVEEEAA
jgi:predicted nucleic acid-binding protein